MLLKLLDFTGGYCYHMSMTPSTYPDIDLIHKMLKNAYEEAVKGNPEKVKDILLECLVTFSKVHSEPKSVRRKKHKWSFDEEIVGFYLANKYSDTSSFRTDRFTKRLIRACPTISLGSFQMLIQNFYYLLKKDKGLKSASRLAKSVHKQYKGYKLSELESLAEKAMGRLE